MNGQRSASSPTIVQTAAASGDHSTLVAAVQAAGLADTLSGPGPFTVFAPTNSAFAKLPPGTVASLLRAENRDKLQSILTYHVVPGRVTAADLVRKIKAGRGQARIATVQGGILTARMAGKQVVIVDANGGTARVSTADLMQSNGVIHVTDAVSLPK
ncbi:MAG TPA: fasciclin domain-containing protein [Allosphingosinicella sp.]